MVCIARTGLRFLLDSCPPSLGSNTPLGPVLGERHGTGCPVFREKPRIELKMGWLAILGNNFRMAASRVDS